MKSVKNSVLAVLLLCLLALRTLAGDIQTPGVAGPPPPPPTNVTFSEDTTQPSMGQNSSGETVETSDYLLFEALAALLYLY